MANFVICVLVGEVIWAALLIRLKERSWFLGGLGAIGVVVAISVCWSILTVVALDSGGHP